MQDKLFILPSRPAAEAGRVSDRLSVRLRNLPAQLTSLIGREHEVAAVCALLGRPEVRLLTLTGTAGVGKTCLALQVATDLLDDFADGVCFVSLAPISDPELVMPTIAQILGLWEAGDRPLLEHLKAYLRNQHLLLLLDNFEQVLTAAPQAVDLLTACPQLKVLVTSREVLHLQAEYLFPVSPLALPDLAHLPEREELAQCAAVSLFLQCARAILSDFQLTKTNTRAIAEICVRLDGLPLALELAAARVRLLPPQALLARLEHRLAVLTSKRRDVPARQQTLRATLEWSYGLLTPEEQRLFRQLSVFVGGWTLEAVEAVANTGQQKGCHGFSALNGLASLLDKSLLVRLSHEGQQEPRFSMLETIREYGLECLAAQGEMEATRRTHAAYYLHLAQQAEKELGGAQQAAWLEQLEQEHENLRAALNWFLERGEATPALSVCAAIWWFWSVRGHVTEGRTFLERALTLGVSLAGSQVAPVVRAKALNAAGMLALNQDDYDAGEAFCTESLALFRELGDQPGIALTLYRLGLLAWWKCQYPAARALEEEALALYRQMGDKGGAADPLLILSKLALDQGNYAQAYSLAQESLALFRAVGDRWGLAYVLLHLARVIFAQGDAARAGTLVEECLAISRELGYKQGIAESFALLGQFALYQGDTALAHSLLAESQLLFREVGDCRGTARSLCLVANVIAAQGDHSRARALYQESLTLLRALGDKEYLALCLEGLAAVLAAPGNVVAPLAGARSAAPANVVAPLAGARSAAPANVVAPLASARSMEALAGTRSAVRLWGMAEALRDAHGISMPPVYRLDYERTVAAAHAQLGEKAFATAWAQGRTMTPEQALAAQGPATLPEEVPSVAQPTTAKTHPTYPAGLTAREAEVLRLLAQGLTDAQIAETLVISPRTVNWHLTTIYSKLQVSSRCAATRYALEHKLT